MNSDSSIEQQIPSEKLVKFHFLTGLNGPIDPLLAYEGNIKNGVLPTEEDELRSFNKTLGRFSLLVGNAIVGKEKDENLSKIEEIPSADEVEALVTMETILGHEDLLSRLKKIKTGLETYKNGKIAEDRTEMVKMIDSLRLMIANKHRLITDEQQGPFLPIGA